MTPTHIRWNSIELLHNAVRTLNYLHDNLGHPLPTVAYRAKVKLHGSNVGVQITDEGVFPQSRSQMLVGGEDYKGFAQWVASDRILEYFRSLPTGITIFGEWCGPGVEKGMAISQVPDKVFAVFGVQRGRGVDAEIIYVPEEISTILHGTREAMPTGMFILPWVGSQVNIAFGLPEDIERNAETINEWVGEVEREDPWVKATFGISGMGEGLVFYPVFEHATGNAERLAQLMFKAKGDKHRTAGQRAAQAQATAADGVDEFVAQVVTEARLKQGVAEVCGGTAEKRHTGKFMQWVEADVQKETVAELEASGLTWEQVRKPVQTKAREWFLGQ